jgi:hypothetical protein
MIKKIQTQKKTREILRNYFLQTYNLNDSKDYAVNYEKRKRKKYLSNRFPPEHPPSGRNQVTDELPALFPRFLELGLLFFCAKKRNLFNQYRFIF